MPPHSLSPVLQEQLCEQMRKMTLALGVVGLVNAQFAIQNDEIYVLEVNPRASRTVPFVAKASGLSLAQIAARCTVGQSLREQGVSQIQALGYYTVKKPVFPFNKFPGCDPILGPEMRSTGEVMGISESLGAAFAKGQLASKQVIPQSGSAFISVRDADKNKLKDLALKLIDNGFELLATRGTAAALEAQGVAVTAVNKVHEGRPHIVDRIKNDGVQFIVNTTEGERAVLDSAVIRRSAVAHGVCYTTTLAGAQAACRALQYTEELQVMSLQQRHASLSVI